jgi:hypothetical protein
MKKLFLGVAALAFVLINSPAFAAAPRVPTSLCLDFVAFADFHQVAIKALGSVKSSGGTAKMYQISGHASGIAQYPVHGNGYVAPGTTVLHASYNGVGRVGASNSILSWELFYDVVAKTGSAFARFLHDGGGSFNGGPFAVVPTDCAALPIASKLEGEGDKAVGEQ